MFDQYILPVGERRKGAIFETTGWIWPREGEEIDQV
jgi:hypothetical protein